MLCVRSLDFSNSRFTSLRAQTVKNPATRFTEHLDVKFSYAGGGTCFVLRIWVG